ncbi:MAG: hypothetical protein ACM34N_17335 [Ignavibacteria bacterium]
MIMIPIFREKQPFLIVKNINKMSKSIAAKNNKFENGSKLIVPE